VLLRHARFEVVTFWDDDDIYLPHRLSYGVELLQNRLAVSEAREWRMGLDHPLSLTLRGVRPFGAMTLLRSAIERVGGFPPLERNQVCFMVAELVRARLLHDLPPTPRCPSTIYRLHAKVARAHVTDAPGGDDQAAVRNFFVHATAAALASGDEPAGLIDIRPGWQHDYVALATNAWLTSEPGPL
jgi:hypothetical protein